MSIKVDNLANELTKTLQSYTDDVVEKIFKATKDYAEIGVTQLKNTIYPEASKSGSAKPITRRNWKRYASSWTTTTKEGSNFIHVAIHNKKYYRLTHLLEYGHATRNGTRTREFRHIEPVEVYCTNELEKKIPKIIKEGGK